jgi:two-component system sensor histidine kinase BaeS
MRSLTWKLTLAFLLVGLIGVLLVALLVSQRTRSEFDRFLSTRDRTVLVNALADYYAGHNSWDGVGSMLAASPPLSLYMLLCSPTRGMRKGSACLAVNWVPPPRSL